MLIQYQQQCCAYIQSIVYVTEHYGGMVVFLSRIQKHTCLSPGAEVGDIAGGVCRASLVSQRRY